MAVTDLTGTTWLINNAPTAPSETLYGSINFTSNSNQFEAITLYDQRDGDGNIAYRNSQDYPFMAYDRYDGWASDAYKTIAITGGTDATNSDLISWLEANASNVTPASPDVVISYNNAEIATMSASGTKTLETEGTFCTDDITVVYTKPSAPTPTLQAKTNIAPTTSSQTITADAGYDGLSSVQINAISPRRTSNDVVISGKNITVNYGYYLSQVSKSVASGTQGTPTATKGTVSNHAIGITPSVTNTAGWITGGTLTGTAVSVSASELVSGTKSITENGTGIDVTNYASVDVNVSGGGGLPGWTDVSSHFNIGGDYDYFIALYNSTLKTAWLCLVCDYVDGLPSVSDIIPDAYYSPNDNSGEEICYLAINSNQSGTFTADLVQFFNYEWNLYDLATPFEEGSKLTVSGAYTPSNFI